MTNNQLPEVSIWTDGSGTTKGKPGGWAAIMVFENGPVDVRKVVYGSLQETSSSQAELTAVLMGLNALKTSCRVHIFSDSMYVINGMTSWVWKWERWDWKTQEGEDVKNSDLWMKLIDAANRHTVRYTHVKGHVGIELNELADSWASAWRNGCGEYQVELLPTVEAKC